MTPIAGALLVFALRVTDVSIGTLRMLYAVRGRRFPAAGLALIESSVFVIAISQVMAGPGNWYTKAGYACGFATGTLLGITIERWIGSGWLLGRIISRERSAALLAALRDAGFGVTAVEGHGRDADVLVLFVVVRRRLGEQMLRVVREADPEAFVTTDTVNLAAGGYLPHTAGPAGVRK